MFHKRSYFSMWTVLNICKIWAAQWVVPLIRDYSCILCLTAVRSDVADIAYYVLTTIIIL